MSDPGITESQAHYVLSRMLADKRVNRRDIAKYLSQMQSEIKELENRLEQLKSLSGSGSGGTKRAGKTTKAKKRVSRKPNPQQIKSRKIQGVYMSLIRQIPKTKRATYKKTAKEKNREAAIAAMKKTLGIK